MRTITDFDLQLFAEGAAASGTTAGSGEGAATVSTATESAAPNETGEAIVKYGIQPESETASVTEDEPGTEAGESQEAAPKMYTEEEYKKGKEDAVKKRLKTIERDKQAIASEREKMSAIYRYCSEIFDCAPSDLETMAKKATEARKESYQKEGVETGNDPSKIEQRADDRYETFNYKDKMKAINNERFNQRMDSELTEAKKKYPDIDLHAEFENSSFRTLINNGFSVLNAYESVHGPEIQERIRANAIEEAKRMIAADIAAGQNRPAENGTASSSAIQHITDPGKLTKAQRADVKAKVRRGERIIW